MEFRKIQILKNDLKMKNCFGKLFEKGNFENWIWKLDLKIGILEKYLKIEVLKIKFWRMIWEWNFKKKIKIRILGNYFKNEVLKILNLEIKILGNYLKTKFKSGNFGKLNFDMYKKKKKN